MGSGGGFSSTPRPPLPRKRPGTHFTGGWAGPRAGLYGRKNLVPTGIRSRTVQPVVSLYTDWATRPTLIDCCYYSNQNGTTSKQRFKEQDFRKFYKVGFPFDFRLCNKFSYGSLAGPSQNLIPLLLLMQHRPKWRTDKYTHSRNGFRTSSPSVREGRKQHCLTSCHLYKEFFFLPSSQKPPPPGAPYRIRFIVTNHNFFNGTFYYSVYAYVVVITYRTFRVVQGCW